MKRRGFGNNVNEAETKECWRPEAGPPLARWNTGGLVAPRAVITCQMFAYDIQVESGKYVSSPPPA